MGDSDPRKIAIVLSMTDYHALEEQRATIDIGFNSDLKKFAQDQHNMKIFDIFSKRQKRSRGEVPDVYQHETIPDALRIQIVYILEELSGIIFPESKKDEVWGRSLYQICKERGIKIENRWAESDGSFLDYFNDGYWCFSIIKNKIETEKNPEYVLDFIETSFLSLSEYVKDKIEEKHYYASDFTDDTKKELEEGRKKENERTQKKFEDAQKELNHRFQEHGVGYQYEYGKIIRVDSQIIHSEMVQPALNMLSNPMYEGANAEFLTALEHYRKRRYKECLNDCLKAFESCLKAICEKRKWKYNQRDTANRLIEVVFKQGLVPNFMQSHFSALRSTLEAGVPTVRNQLSAHGQGSTVVAVPEHIAGYALHLTASNILLLAKADEEMK